MRAITFHGAEEVRLEQVPDPGLLAATDVVLRVVAAGICGSDLHVYHGRESGLDSGTVLGHEVVGEVVEAGPEVRHLRRGDRVVAPFTTSCGDCFYCVAGLTARCERGGLFGWVEKGQGLHGAQAEYLRVPCADATLVKVPEGLDETLALLAGDVLATGLFAADLGGVMVGQTVAVVGCGAVGLMAAVGALERGAERVYAIDPLEDRRARAERFGALGLAPGEVAAQLAEATAGRGADVVLEAVGNAAATRSAFDAVRPGGTLAAVGVHTEPHLAVSPAELYDKNLTYRAGRCSARRFVEPGLSLLASRRRPFEEVVSHQLPLDEGVEAYRRFAAREPGCSKIVLRP